VTKIEVFFPKFSKFSPAAKKMEEIWLKASKFFKIFACGAKCRVFKYQFSNMEQLRKISVQFWSSPGIPGINL